MLPEPIDGPRAPEPSVVAKNQGRIVVVAESKGEVEWVEVYDWKTGCCYFMQEDTGQSVGLPLGRSVGRSVCHLPYY